MTRPHVTARLGLSALVLATLQACTDNIGPETPTAGSVTIAAPVLDVPVGGALQLTATVLSPTGALMSNAPVAWSSSNQQVGQVNASGMFTALTPGVTTVRATAGGRTGSLELYVRPGECGPPPLSAPLSPGQTRTGVLDAAGCLLPFSGLPGAAVPFTMTSGTRARLRVSAAFPPVVFVTDPMLNFVSYAMNPSGQEATLVLELPAGTYVAWVSTLDGSLGSWTVSLETLPAAACERHSLTLAQAATGALSDTSCSLPDRPGHLTEGWEFQLTEPTAIVLDVGSNTFDTMLYLKNAAGSVIDFDDDGGPGTDSRISRQLPAGSYTAWVTSYMPGVTGAYRIALKAAAACTINNTVGAVQVGQSAAGTLGQDACTLLDGPAAEGWSVALAAPTRLRFRVSNAAFAPMVAVTDRQLNLLGWAPPSGPSSTSFVIDLPAGEYIVWVGSFESGSGGYELSVAEVTTSCTSSGTLSIGQSVAGTITDSGCALPVDPSRLANFWQLPLTARTSMQIDLMSTAFDALLLVLDAGGNVVAFDDDGGDGLNSRLRVTLDPGTYTVWATTFAPGATGAYQLSVQPASSSGMAGSRATGGVSLPFADREGPDRWRLKGAAQRRTEVERSPSKAGF